MNRIQGPTNPLRTLRRAAVSNDDTPPADGAPLADDTPPADGAPLIEGIDRIFGGLGARGRVVLSQLPLSVTLFLIVVAALIFSPATLADGTFRLALLAQAIMFAL